MGVKSGRSTFLEGIGAGLFIGFGCLFCNLAKAWPFPSSVVAVVSALLFSVGMLSVCYSGVPLYTGRVGFVLEGNKKANVLALPEMLLGNVVGIVSLALFSYGVAALSAPGFNEIVSVTASTRVAGSLSGMLRYFFQAVACGFFVYEAVRCYKKLPKWFKPIGVVAFIFIFVYAGMQHSIANCFYLTYGALGDPLVLGWGLASVLTAVLGNSVGALAFGALDHWAA